MTRRNLAFLDVETSHLSPALGRIVELAYVVCTPWPELKVLRSLELAFTLDASDLQRASLQALAVNGYHQRPHPLGSLGPAAMNEALDAMLCDAATVRIVGSNPWFDRQHVLAEAKRYRGHGVDPLDLANALEERWGHRMVDVGAYCHIVAERLELETSGLHAVYAALGGEPLPEHRAMADVKRAMFVYDWMQEVGVRWLRPPVSP